MWNTSWQNVKNQIYNKISQKNSVLMWWIEQCSVKYAIAKPFGLLSIAQKSSKINKFLAVNRKSFQLNYWWHTSYWRNGWSSDRIRWNQRVHVMKKQKSILAIDFCVGCFSTDSTLAFVSDLTQSSPLNLKSNIGRKSNSEPEEKFLGCFFSHVRCRFQSDMRTMKHVLYSVS